MIVKDHNGNEFVELITVDENSAIEGYFPVTHCLVVVMVGNDYLLGWNNWRQNWEIFGGCLEKGETMRECITRECMEEIGISNVSFDYIGLMHFNMMPDYFSTEHRKEYGGLYGIQIQTDDLKYIEKYRLDRDEIGKIAFLKDIDKNDRIAEIDRELLKYYPSHAKPL
ncbi:MAG: NUDIX domain-containing protein [Lachnospiraceae bacterium]|nr:NUDIX domain-containing protein [Lachnospiraceae bacterium]